MQPKLIAASVAAALAGVSAPLYAGPFDPPGGSDVKAMAYVSVPFGGTSRSQEAPILGFALNQTQRAQPGDGFSYHPALFQMSPVSAVRSFVDVRFNTQKRNWDRLRIGGADLLTYSTRLKADGTTETVAEVGEISTVAIVAGVAVGVVVVHDATKKDNPAPASSSGGCVGAGCGGGI